MTSRISNAGFGIGSWTGAKVRNTEHEETCSNFSTLLDKMKKGQSPSLSSNDGGDPEKTVTVTRILSDGSTLITVMREGKIVSQSKTHAVRQEDSPKLLDTISQVGLGISSASMQDEEGAETGGAVAAGQFYGVGAMDLLAN